MAQLYKSYRKKLRSYALGGDMNEETDDTGKKKNGNLAGTLGTVGALGTTLIDSIDTGNMYGRQSTGSTIAKGALSGAAAGATLGPIGAGVGAVVGLVGGLFGAKKARKAEDKMKADMLTMDNLKGSTYANTPDMYQGNTNAGYFATGGSLSSNYLSLKKAKGGNIQQGSSDGVSFNGQSHTGGGIKIPSIGVEVEGQETAKGDYVFSKQLGFAQLHKPIMKAKGIIEMKPATRERINSIKLLNQREDKLRLAQEYFKQTHGLQ